MDRFKEFLRTKGLYIAIGTGVLAFVGLMVILQKRVWSRQADGGSECTRGNRNNGTGC